MRSAEAFLDLLDLCRHISSPGVEGLGEGGLGAQRLILNCEIPWD